MRLGIFLSALFHLTVLLAGLVVLPAKWNEQEKYQMIPVELLTIADMTNVIAKSEETAEEPELALPEPEERKAEAAPPPAPEPEPEVVSEDAMPPLPELKPKEKKPEPKKEVTPKVVKPSTSLAKARPRKKPTPPTSAEDKDDFNLDNIAALLDKTPTEDKKAPVVEKDDSEFSKMFADLMDNDQEAVGLGNDMTISEMDALEAHIARCWRLPSGAANPEELVVDLRVFLNRDGSLASPPEVISSGASTFGGNTFVRAAEDAARRAVVKCAPYDFLPDDKYDRWDDFTMTFDPAKMIGR